MDSTVNKSKDQPVYTSSSILTTDPVVSTDQVDIYSNSQEESQNSSCEIIDVVIESSAPPVYNVVKSHSADLTTINNQFDSPTTTSLSTYDSNQHYSSSTDYIEYGDRDCYSRRQGSFYRYSNYKLIAELVYKDDVLVYTHREFKDNKMKEYNTDHELIYEGNYDGNRKNGFYRNGSGKEYRYGQLYFEGNWEKNIVNGFGVLYDEEGEWIKGWIGLDYEYYCKDCNRFYNHLPGYFFVCCDFIVGVFYLLTALLIHIVFNVDSYSVVFFIVIGVFYILKSFCDDGFSHGCKPLFAQIFFCSNICVIIILPYGDLEQLVRGNTFFQKLLDISLALYFFYIISTIMLFFCGLSYPEDLVFYLPKRGINSYYYCIMENIFCYVLFIHGYIILWFYGSLCSKVFLILFISLMLFDILVYWIVYKLHSRSKKTFVLGSIIGMVWGLFSLLLFFILSFFTVFNSWIIDSSIKSGVIINIVILMCYTWFLSLSSFLLYKNNKPDTTLPITH